MYLIYIYVYFLYQNVSVETQFLCCLVYRRFVTVFHCGKLCSAHNFSKLCTKATVQCIISSKTVQSRYAIKIYHIYIYIIMFSFFLQGTALP